MSGLFVSVLCPRRKVEAPSSLVVAHFEPQRLCQSADSDKRQPATDALEKYAMVRSWL